MKNTFSNKITILNRLCYKLKKFFLIISPIKIYIFENCEKYFFK